MSQLLGLELGGGDDVVEGGHDAHDLAAHVLDYLESSACSSRVRLLLLLQLVLDRDVWVVVVDVCLFITIIAVTITIVITIIVAIIIGAITDVVTKLQIARTKTTMAPKMTTSNKSKGVLDL